MVGPDDLDDSMNLNDLMLYSAFSSFLLLLCLGNNVWRSGHLLEQLCCTEACASQHCHSRNQSLINTGTGQFLSISHVL